MPEAELITAARGGDRKATEQLMKRYKNAIENAARKAGRFIGREEEYYQIAVVGFLTAIKKHDASRGTFQACVFTWLRKTIQEAEPTHGGRSDTMILGEDLFQDSPKIHLDGEEWCWHQRREHDIAPNDTHAEVERMQIRARVRDQVYRTLKGKKPLEAAVVRERILADEPATFMAIGQRYGVSHARIQQVEQKMRQRFRIALREVA